MPNGSISLTLLGTGHTRLGQIIILPTLLPTPFYFVHCTTKIMPDSYRSVKLRVQDGRRDSQWNAFKRASFFASDALKSANAKNAVTNSLAIHIFHLSYFPLSKNLKRAIEASSGDDEGLRMDNGPSNIILQESSAFLVDGSKKKRDINSQI
ncbi:MAG: hypothetical protein Q9216_006024 [Gyalolechia sp. 2 TL-2023]